MEIKIIVDSPTKKQYAEFSISISTSKHPHPKNIYLS
jgi:hypothetical protein